MPSKHGIHGILPGATLGIMQQLLASGTRMATVKAVEGIGWLKDAKSIDPDVITVGRYMVGVDPSVSVEFPDLSGDLLKSARKIMHSLLPKWEPHRDYVDYWEVANELDPDTAEGHRCLAEVMIYCMEIAESEGYHLGLFSYSLGVPEWSEMQAVVETGVFGKAKAGGHMFSLHEYAYPMDRWYGEPLPGLPTYPNRGPLACRYRWWYEDFLKPRDEVIPLFITELNLLRDMPLVTPEAWIQQMAWYDARMREDYYVVGSHLFTLGGGGSWANFEFTKMLPALVEHMVAIKDEQDPVWPTVVEKPKPVEPEPPIVTPPPVTGPRVPFQRHYLLLPPGSDWRWVAACQRYWETFGVTIGKSADDAAYGPGLTERAVTAVNPHLWGNDLQEFFEEHYPGIRYDPVTAPTPADLESRLAARVASGRRFGD